MPTSKRKQYELCHTLAKLLVSFCVVLLLILSRNFEMVSLDIAAVIVWFFGVNPVAYCLESVLRFQHRHNIF